MSTEQAEQTEPKWRPLSAIQRRVIGVLVEKAKTTPEQYPLTINSLRTGSNQKSNRFPVMNLEAEQVEDAVDRLREIGLLTEVQGSGRVLKYRHLAYEWLGVDKIELAVITELLLRGAQTIGELRGRAARMERIADLSELRPILASLEAKGLVIALTPEGRGQVVTHSLYQPQELARIRAEHRGGGAPRTDDSPEASVETVPRRAPPTATTSPTTSQAIPTESMEALRREVAELRDQLAQLRNDMEQVTSDCRRGLDEINELRQALGE